MFTKLRVATRNLCRPLYAPVAIALRRRLGRNYWAHPEMELPPPYEAIQLDVERHLHQYLHVAAEDISQIVIVGAAEAGEIHRLKRVYSRAQFLCFEPNPNSYQQLLDNFRGYTDVTSSNLALSDAPGQARFYELDHPGNGSLLEPDAEQWSKLTHWERNQVTSFEVQLSTLDLEAANLPAIDLLWMDVQGAEGRVLAGATETLRRTKAVFLEVALSQSPYKGAPLFDELNALLKARGFDCLGLGLDAWNGAGNAFFVRQFGELVCK